VQESEQFKELLKGLTDYLYHQEQAISELRKALIVITGLGVEQAKDQRMIQLQTEEKVEKIKALFGDLSSFLNFEFKDGKWLIKPRQYLGAENFAKIAQIVREHKGDYVSMGKDSHFVMPA